MDRIELIWMVRIVGVLGILALVVGSVMPKPELTEEERNRLRSAGFRGPITGLELSKRNDLFQMIAGTEDRRAVIRRNLRIDFLFIPTYVLLYAALASLLAQRDTGWPLALGAAAGALAAAAGVFDVVENRRVLDLLAVSQPDGGLDGVWLASVLKWTAIAASSLLLSALFLARHAPFEIADLYFILLGVLLVLAGIGLGTAWRGGLAELSMMAMIPALALVIPWAIWPAWILDRLWK